MLQQQPPPGAGGNPNVWINPDNVPAGEHLKKYALDLTERAEQGKLDPVIGREEEIRRTVQVGTLFYNDTNTVHWILEY